MVAYSSAAKAVREASVSVAGLARQGRATELPGIGKTLQEKILALAETGDDPRGGAAAGEVPGGADRPHPPARAWARSGHGCSTPSSGVDSPEALREAAEDQRLRSVKGLGPKFEESMLAALEQAERHPPDRSGRVLLPRAMAIGEDAASRTACRSRPRRTTVELAGSIRRRADSVKDIDLVAATDDPAALRRAARRARADRAGELLGHRRRAGSHPRGHRRRPAHRRPRVSWARCSQHFTGSGAHNAALREAAVRRGLHVSEYGILDDATGETEAFASGAARSTGPLGLAYIEPELREDRGELAAARPTARCRS